MHWDKFKTIRNKINDEINNLKANYFKTKILECVQHKNVKKSRCLINNLLGKNPKSTVVNEIKTDGNVFTDSNLIANKLRSSYLSYYANISNLENNTIFYFSEITLDQIFKIND